MLQEFIKSISIVLYEALCSIMAQLSRQKFDIFIMN